MKAIFAEERQKGSYLGLVASLVLQCACLWGVSTIHLATHGASPYVVIPLAAARPLLYQRPRTPSQQGNVKWSNVKTDGPRTLRGPNVPRKSQGSSYGVEEGAPMIGNSAFGFADPLTLSSDQPSRPFEIRIGDFGVETSAMGSPRSGHRSGNGFVVSGFDGGSGVGQEPMDREPVRIISKPTPAYTEDALNKKIEGDMVLDLIFTADRRIVVLQILRSIGHGLDETGLQAVSRIVFRPAKEKGRPIDFRARVRVEFRLIPVQASEEGDSMKTVFVDPRPSPRGMGTLQR